MSSYNSQKETNASKTQAGMWGLAPGHLEGMCVCVGQADTDELMKAAGSHAPDTSSREPPPLALQRIRQLMCPAEDLPGWKRAEPSAPATPRTSLLILTELESHC